MIPDFTFLNKTFSAYMLVATFGILLMLFFSYKTAKKQGLDEIHMLYLSLFSLIGVFFGMHLLYGIVNFKYIIHFFNHFFDNPSFGLFIDYIMVTFGGSVFYGGLIGGMLVAYIYIKKNKLDLRSYSDVAVLMVPLFHFFGRIGCFLSGCCYGIECDFGITYHYSAIEAANGVSRFPVQLLEALLNAAIFFVLWHLLRIGKAKGKLTLLYLLIYPTCRFILEFLRGDEYRGFVFGVLSTSQFISVILFILSVTALLVINKKEKQPAAKTQDQVQG